jgi:hypothetical protein
MRILLVALLLAACSGRGEGRSPQGAVQLLVDASRVGDRVGVYQRLGPRTRARIEAQAEGTRRTGGQWKVELP